MRPRPPRLLVLFLSLAVCACILHVAPELRADERADRLLNLLKKRPRNKSLEAWQEERREAARELGRLKDKRAVATLLGIIAKERFDVILEIAIDALGEIGDKRAGPPLKKLLNDPSLDAYVRDAVAGALRKLGEESAPGTEVPPKPPTKPGKPSKPGDTGSTGETGTTGETGETGRFPESKETTPEPSGTDLASRLAKANQPFGGLPPLPLGLAADVIAGADRWDVAAAAAHLRWDKAAGQTAGTLTLRSRVRRQVERKSMGYTIDGALDLGFSAIDTPQGDTSWNLGQSLQVNPEIRFYPFQRDVPLLFGQVSGGAGYGLDYSAPPLALDRRFSIAGTVAVGAGPGYGRIYDIGSRIRLRRLVSALRKAGLLTGTVDCAVGDQLIQIWHHLRNHLGTFYHLGYTLDALQRAGLLRGESIDPATTYRLIRILDDPQLEDRRNGMLFRLGYGYARNMIKDVDDVNMAFLYATAEHAWQISTIRALESSLRFFYQMVDDPDTYGVTAQAAYTHYLYNAHDDPLGALSATLSGGINNQPGARFDGGGLGYQAMAGASYTRFFNRGSRIVASARLGIDTGSPLFLISLEAQYGVAYGSIAPAE